MVRSPIALLVVLAAGSAGAQSTITISRPVIDRTTCLDNSPVIINVNAQDNSVPSRPLTNLTITSEWTIWVSSTGSCSDTTFTPAQLLTDNATMDVSSAASGTYSLTVSAQTLVGAVNDQDAETCGGKDGVSKQRNVCAKYTTSRFGSATVTVDTQPLEPPTITGVAVGDSKVRLRVSPPSGQSVTGYQAYSRIAFCEGSSVSGLPGAGSGGGGAGGSAGAGGSGGSGGSGGAGPGGEICGNGKDDDGDGLVDCKDADCAGKLRELGGTKPSTALGFTKIATEFGNVTTLTVDGLQNGTTYQFFVVARRASDTSDPSNVVTGTPKAVTTFFEAYRSAGGQETGCAAAPPGGLASALGLLALAAVLRRARSR